MNEFSLFETKMNEGGCPPLVVDTFRRHFERFRDDAGGAVLEKEIEPVGEKNIAHYDDLSRFSPKGRQALARTAVIKLNGGLGTSMGLSGPKSRIAVRDGLTFLDITLRHIRALHQSKKTTLPFITMNSFRTDGPTQDVLARYPDLAGSLPRSFLQNRYPKIDARTRRPLSCPHNPQLEWNPPGHGDIYTALQTSGMLAALMENNIEWVFISNIDNLGASIDEAILGFCAEYRIPFLMEVARRTPMDKKGGHLARRPDGSLLLRERAQCREEDLDAFSDIDRHRFFNTNNIWIHLPALARILEKTGGVLDLPLIRNVKPADPARPGPHMAVQLETAMGSAISLINGARAVAVGRERFVPVKKCDDLLVVGSDWYDLSDQFVLQKSPDARYPVVSIELDPDFYRLYHDFTARFPGGMPSLKECSSLTIHGDVAFGKEVVVRGEATITNESDVQVTIEDGTVLAGENRLGSST